MKKVALLLILLIALIFSWYFISNENSRGFESKSENEEGDFSTSREGEEGQKVIYELKNLNPRQETVMEEEVSTPPFPREFKKWKTIEDINKHHLEKIQGNLVRIPLRHTEEKSERILSVEDGVSKIMTVSHAYTRGLRVKFTYSDQDYYLYSFLGNPSFSSGYAISRETGHAFRWDLN